VPDHVLGDAPEYESPKPARAATRHGDHLHEVIAYCIDYYGGSNGRLDDANRSIMDIESKLSSGGLTLYVRYVKNQFDIPFFMAVVSETKSDDPIYISVGYGCHPLKEIAVTRAVCEALQSRLSFIHGGRDDLIERYDRFKGRTRKMRMRYAEGLLKRVSHGESTNQFDDISDLSKSVTDLQSSLDVLLTMLRRDGFRHVLRVVYTPPKLPLQVVRILIPGLECFTEATARIGVRLRDYVRAQI